MGGGQTSAQMHEAEQITPPDHRRIGSQERTCYQAEMSS